MPFIQLFPPLHFKYQAPPFLLFFLFFFSFPFSLPFLSSFLFVSSCPNPERLERDQERKKERPREMQRIKENLRGGVWWASHHLGRTTASGPVDYNPTLVKPKSLGFRHFLSIQTVENQFFLGKYML
jgi:hypothetical protein